MFATSVCPLSFFCCFVFRLTFPIVSIYLLLPPLLLLLLASKMRLLCLLRYLETDTRSMCQTADSIFAPALGIQDEVALSLEVLGNRYKEHVLNS
jgi:hypothetical protein